MMSASLAVVKPWIAKQIGFLDSVRITGINRDGVIVVQSWGGTSVHLYASETPMKPRLLKRLLSENTRVGVGTLCLVDAAALPHDGERLTPDESLLALHALFKDKIYTYRLDGDTPKIGQVHLKNYGRDTESEVWYGPDVDVRSLPSYRMWIKQPVSIRGDWLVATFGAESFWKNADYHAGREAMRREQYGARDGAAEEAAARYEWTNSTYTNVAGGYRSAFDSNYQGGRTGATGRPPAPATPPISRLDRSYQALGVAREASCDEVKAAFRRLARELHPDVSKLPKPEAEARFKTVYEAYKLIKDERSC